VPTVTTVMSPPSPLPYHQYHHYHHYELSLRDPDPLPFSDLSRFREVSGSRPPEEQCVGVAIGVGCGVGEGCIFFLKWLEWYSSFL
jgi:hypothetical protein